MTDRPIFALPDALAGKGAPDQVGHDEEKLAAIQVAMTQHIDDLTERRTELLGRSGGNYQAMLDRDLDVHRVTARLRMLTRFEMDLCLGRVVREGDPEPIYIGRIGVTDSDGDRVLVDWRSPAAEPFFSATLADPMGLVSRRRYRWRDGQVVDYWDEQFALSGEHAPTDGLALDDQAAFIASLGQSRSSQMRDVLTTIQSDQDAAIRADSRGSLVVDGGPGTGKTVVALHRAAYLLYSDPRVSEGRGGVLVVGPHRPYLGFVSDVLPNLGEDGVQVATIADLVPDLMNEGEEVVAPDVGEDPAVARLKGSARMEDAVRAAVRFYEDPPTARYEVSTAAGEVAITKAAWAAAFEAAEPGTPHNPARQQIWEALLDHVIDSLEADADEGGAVAGRAALRREVEGDRELAEVFNRAWPLVDPADLIGDLWSVPAFLRRCAPWLEPAEVTMLQRDSPTAWTIADLPLVDAARHLLGAFERPARQGVEDELAVLERETRERVTAEFTEASDGEGAVTMLHGADLQEALAASTETASRPTSTDGPFSHIIVDEAQELTDAQWLMLLRRCPSRSFTVVGDRAQARQGFAETWDERLRRIGLRTSRVVTLHLNYRTPAEVMEEAGPVITAVLPDANVPRSVRRSGLPVRRGAVTELEGILDEWESEHPDGVGCVIGGASYGQRARIRSLSPAMTKGLEFDLVVLVDPDQFGGDVTGAVDRYVAMTRATSQLVVLEG